MSKILKKPGYECINEIGYSKILCHNCADSIEHRKFDKATCLYRNCLRNVYHKPKSIYNSQTQYVTCAKHTCLTCLTCQRSYIKSKFNKYVNLSSFYAFIWGLKRKDYEIPPKNILKLIFDECKEYCTYENKLHRFKNNLGISLFEKYAIKDGFRCPYLINDRCESNTSKCRKYTTGRFGDNECRECDYYNYDDFEKR